MHDRVPTPDLVPPAIAAGARSLRGRGRPLPEPMRQSLERSTGRRLAHVRVHDDPLSRTLSSAVGARAFTVGGDVALGRGGRDRRVLAHELGHAAQQSATPGHGPLAASRPGDAIERAVDAPRVRRAADQRAACAAPATGVVG